MLTAIVYLILIVIVLVTLAVVFAVRGGLSGNADHKAIRENATHDALYGHYRQNYYSGVSEDMPAAQHAAIYNTAYDKAVRDYI
jgi:hypothetical protein